MRLRSISLKTVIAVSSILLVVLILVFMAVALATRLSSMIQASAMERTKETVDQGNTSLDIYFSGMLESMSFFQSMIADAADVRGGELSERMDLFKRSRKDLANLAVFSVDGELLNAAGVRLSGAAGDIKRAGWFEHALAARPSTVSFSAPYLQSIFAGQYAWVVTISTQVDYRLDGAIHTGVLMMDINFSSIDSMCENIRLGDSGYVYLIDSNYELVYHPQQQLITSGLKRENIDKVRSHVFGRFFDDTMDGRERYVIVQTVNNTGWRLVGVAYVDEILPIQSEMFRLMVTLSISGLLLATALSVVLAQRIVRPMRRLERVMRGVENGDMTVSIEPAGFYEIDSLSRTFGSMILRIRELMGQIVREQEAKRLHELNALQAQINPHFLYNTLDSIVWMLEVGQDKEAIVMVTALARLFRISISKGSAIITVREELEHVRNYLIIQSMRFKDKFVYSIDAAPETLALRTVKLILQPMVENAIVHGLEQFSVDRGVIKVSARLEDGDLFFRIEDNGCGMSEEQQREILSTRPGSSGIGVKNVHERIGLTFGKRYGLTIRSELDLGTEITIRLPVIREGDEPT